PFLVTTFRTPSLRLSRNPGASLLCGSSHDTRWLRLHPQLPGADAAGGWTQLIENVDVPLADALAASELAAAHEASLDLVTDGETRARVEPAEDGRAGVEREVGVGGDREPVGGPEAFADELL